MNGVSRKEVFLKGVREMFFLAFLLGWLCWSLGLLLGYLIWAPLKPQAGQEPKTKAEG